MLEVGKRYKVKENAIRDYANAGSILVRGVPFTATDSSVVGYSLRKGYDCGDIVLADEPVMPAPVKAAKTSAVTTRLSVESVAKVEPQVEAVVEEAPAVEEVQVEAEVEVAPVETAPVIQEDPVATVEKLVHKKKKK